jgi:hypothetical protein
MFEEADVEDSPTEIRVSLYNIKLVRNVSLKCPGFAVKTALYSNFRRVTVGVAILLLSGNFLLRPILPPVLHSFLSSSLVKNGSACPKELNVLHPR